MRPGLKWSRGYKVLDYVKLQERKPGAFSVITVPEISVPKDPQGEDNFLFPIATAREKATSDFKPLEFNQLELTKLEDQIMALEDEEDIPLLDLDKEFF